ncbi:cell division protein ZapA [Pseudodesulfovibrio cashew]|uniref:Cell division protein ZapA n=1 Tax=Pseudodesulfovibrio cashew TaxID=2678688 RepID=A0A6I6JGA6_9BACT|nr:cell division protein ZapA [Pseudodesulfovibrio cashew]QGY39087.1 cell division protein ZapA [Pseudodesulfovibrio cashew]
MPRYTLNLFGLEISFKTDAENDRIEAAQEYLEKKYGELTVAAGDLSKEKVLTFMLLSLADDYLVNRSRLAQLEERIGEILEKAE